MTNHAHTLTRPLAATPTVTDRPDIELKSCDYQTKLYTRGSPRLRLNIVPDIVLNDLTIACGYVIDVRIVT